MDKEYDYKAINTNRKSGVIMPISSLSSKYGIGTFGEKAYEFCDFLVKSGLHYWQILPIGPTGYGDSPYQSFSSFAGNPYFIDLDLLEKDRLLKKSEYENINFGDDITRVDYGKLYQNRFLVLKKAYSRFKKQDELDKFVSKNSDWLCDYALFTAIKNHLNGDAWDSWPHDIQNREEKAIMEYKEKLKDEINFQYFIQYMFYTQYNNLKEYVNSKGIEIIGDLPIYCSYDSADVWSNKEQFLNNKVGGCPPDGFSDKGQLWGNPIYNWEYMKKDNYKWWVNRVDKTLKLFDVTRIDHFRGFESYWSIPKGDEDAKRGQWVKGPGYDLFKKIKEELGEIKIIAEDLGYTTKEVVEFREQTNFPGMKMIQFAFDPNNESDFLPHNIERNWAAYASTHDSDTVKGWFDEKMKDKDNKELAFAIDYLKLNEEEGYVWGFIRGAWSSVANIAITQMQDFLELDNSSRMNIPSTLGNWSWRLDDSLLTDEIAQKIRRLNKLYSRERKEN